VKGREKFMAKKRLNKKVALIGSAVFIFLVLAAIGVILYLSRDPEPFIKDGDAAVKAAREATDEQIKEQQYERAERNYGKARALAKTDSLIVEILFKAADMYIGMDRWRNVVGCWKEIIRIDPENIKARYGQLQYFYIMADSGVRQVWQEVASQAAEFIEIADANLLAEDTAKWESFGMQAEPNFAESRMEIYKRETSGGQLGPYLYLLRGRANLEIARMGAVTDQDALLLSAVDDLEKVRELEPDNPQIYWYLAQATITKGEMLASRGNLGERDRAREQAKELLKQAVEVAGEDPRAHINLLTIKLMLAQMSGAVPAREQIQSLEPEYLSLVEKFDTSARAYSALARFYVLKGLKDLDKAIEAAKKAIELDRENVVYAINVASLHYRKFSIYGPKLELYRAIEIAKNTLELPNAQDKPGPRQRANRSSRAILYAFLANCYIEQVLEPCEVRTQAQSQEWLTKAEQAVHEIEQLFGSGENPQVVKWRGMLELAKFELGKGDRNVAIKELYAAYEQLEASGQRDTPLSYTLAKLFGNTTELGAANEFFASALSVADRSVPDKIDERKPEALLDYANLLFKLRDYAAALNVINFFENEYWSDRRSQILRIEAYIAARQFDEAEEELAKKQLDDPNMIKLNLALVQAKVRQVQRAIAQKRTEESLGIISTKPSSTEKEAIESQTIELKGYRDALAELVRKLLSIEPNSVDETSVVAVCNNYMEEGRTSEAKDLVNRFLEYFPANTTALFYKRIFSEPEPGKISQQRRKEIEEEVLSNIDDPVEKSLRLGVFYQRGDELDKAAGEFKKVLKIVPIDSTGIQEYLVERPASEKTEKMTDSQRLAASYLFGIALEAKEWQLAERLAEMARRQNLDDCEGRFFAARLALAKEQYKDALARLEECLKQRPVFSHAFALRSRVNAALGNEHASIEDARKAASFNPLDGAIAKVLATVLYQRNRKLGDNVSSDQIIETQNALDRAMALNPSDLGLLSDYAEYIVSTDSLRALAIRQSLQKSTPSMRNAILLGRLAAKMAFTETDLKRREALFDIVESSFEQARKINPRDKVMLSNYAEYYRLRGQDEKAEQLLLESEDSRVLWSHYFRSGQFGAAKEVLGQLYQSESKDGNVVQGLLLIAERTADKEEVKKYSEELLSLEGSVENHLFQIRTFLRVGLVKEAEYKLQSFKEKFPDEPGALLFEAWLVMKQGQLKKALELANRSLETNQDDAKAWRLRGEINFLMANYGQAVIDLKRSKSLSTEPRTRLALAKAYWRAGREEDAITELENTIDHPQAPVQGRELLEQIYLQLGRKEELKRFYDETLRRFPHSVLWHNRAGEFALSISDFSTAEKLYKQAWQKDEEDNMVKAAAFDGYLSALVQSGKLDEVFEETHEYVNGDFAPVAFFRMAEAKLKLGDKAGAIEYYRKAVDKAGTNETFVYDILQGMYSLLGAQEALKCCQERLETNPDSLAANFAMFNLTKINGEYNKAVDYIDKCLQIAGPDSANTLDYTVKKAEVLTLAYGKTSNNNYPKMPNNMGVLNNLAYMLAEENVRLAEALEYAKRAYEARPNNPGFLDTYSYVLYKNGRLAEAAEFLQSALQQYELNRISAPVEVYEHLGMIKEKLGSGTEALAAYKQALEVGADDLSEVAKKRITSAIERLSQQGEN
jgi:tetratricopeptide (TPR) repeat protein